MKLGALGMMWIVALAGCTARFGNFADSSTSPAAASAAGQGPTQSADNGAPTAAAPPAREVQKVVPAVDPPPLIKAQVNLSIYHLSVPAGSVSLNEVFWKHVDEQALDAGAYDVLYKNGIRIGRGRLADFDYFRKALDGDTVQAEPTIYAAAGARTIELSMKKAVPTQMIYDFDSKNVMTVRSYEDCDNIFCVEFQANPRRPGDVTFSICPMVRSLRTRLVAVGDVDTREIEYQNPEKFFTLNLRTQIPADSCLIIAPSPEAAAPMSLGNAFLVREGAADKFEQVLLVVPQAIKPRPKPTEANATEPSGENTK